MDKRIDILIGNWQKRGILGFYCGTKQEAVDKILQIIPQSGSVGISGSVTLGQLAILRHLEARGNLVFNQNKAGISREESLDLRRKGTAADYYLASANAISQAGEMVFLSAYGNRIAGVSYAANAIIVCGVNKITPDLEEAIKRSREYATALNYKRLNWDKSVRMCCQTLVIEAEAAAERLKVILVGEDLGF